MHVSIQEIADVQIGYQPRGAIETSRGGSHYAIQVKDIQGEPGCELNLATLERLTPDRKPAPYMVQGGDLLFLARGRRRSATVIEALPADGPVIALYYFFILRTRKDLIAPDFLAWLINEGPVQEALARIPVAGTGIPFVSKKSFSEIDFELPSLPCQVRVGNLYKLALRELQLSRLLQQRRWELSRATCLQMCEEASSS